MNIMTNTDPMLQADLFQQRPDPNADLREVAEQFEAIFLNQMLKQMREAKLAEGLFDNSATDTYTSMLDMEQSQHLAANVNLGIADALMRQFGAKLKVE